MVDLRTSYMGLQLNNPIVVGACSLTGNVDRIRRMEEYGAGAVVLKSLFEEQIQLEQSRFEDQLSEFHVGFSEAADLFPNLNHSGTKEHLYWVEKTRAAVKLPLIASLNVHSENHEIWRDYARQLAEAGADALELNFYSPPLDPLMSPETIEASELRAFEAVKETVDIPVSVKLHPYYTNIIKLLSALEAQGAAGVVLFNRLFQPDIDVDAEEKRVRLSLSAARDHLLPLRWSALLYGRVGLDVAASTGIMTGEDVIKMLLAGAQVVQIASTLYTHNVEYLATMLTDISEWMGGKGYQRLDEFRGKVSAQRMDDPRVFERGQYLKALISFA